MFLQCVYKRCARKQESCPDFPDSVSGRKLSSPKGQVVTPSLQLSAVLQALGLSFALGSSSHRLGGTEPEVWGRTQSLGQTLPLQPSHALLAG